jgi:high-affinity Fe2+/Pb2+ permease
MNSLIAGILAREAKKTQSNSHPLTMIAVFCGFGLALTLVILSMGLDLGAGFF